MCGLVLGTHPELADVQKSGIDGAPDLQLLLTADGVCIAARKSFFVCLRKELGK